MSGPDVEPPPAPPAGSLASGDVLVGGLALVVSLPAFLPGAEAYIDNAPHLVEVLGLARHILREDHWWAGWSDLAECGHTVGEANAPLSWAPVAALVALGAPPASTFALASALANVVFALGALRLSRRVWTNESAARIGAVLAVADVCGLYGIGGALGGMWPYRLAIGVLAWGMGSRVEARFGGMTLWLSCLVLLHTFVALFAAAWGALSFGASLVRRDTPGAVRWGLSGAATIVVTACFWAPLMEPATRALGFIFHPGPLISAAAALLPAVPLSTATSASLDWVAGGAGLLVLPLLALGIWRFVTRRIPPVRGELLGRVAFGLGVLLVLVVLIVPLTGTNSLGPNPWRYLALVRLAVALVAGVGLASLAPGLRPLLLSLPVGVALWAGVREIPSPIFGGERALAWADLAATWDALRAELGPQVTHIRVLHEDPMFDSTAPAAFRATHVGALLSARTGIQTVGSWYGINPNPTTPWTVTEGPLTLGGWPGGLAANRDAFAARLRVFGIGAVVSVAPELRRVLDEDDRYRKVAENGPFSAWVLTTPPLSLVGSGAGEVTGLRIERTRIVARVPAGPFRVRIAAHPGWTATLDGVPVPLSRDPGTGLMGGDAPGAGELTVVWTQTGRWGRVVSVIGVALTALGSLLERSPRRRPRRSSA